MVVSRQTSVQKMMISHDGFSEFLRWQGVDESPLDPEETLEELCEAWGMEWEDFEGELELWLEDESEERPMPEWNEPLSPGEE